jgi:hypothetical protein
MGGSNSSRWHEHRKKETVGDYPSLDATKLVKAALGRKSGVLSWMNPVDGQPIEPILYSLQSQEEERLILSLWFPLRLLDGKTKINFLTTKPHFGGVRHWFLCPSCGLKVAKLYTPPDRVELACRTCHNLTYQSVQEHDNRVKRCREHPEELAKVIEAAVDPAASSKRQLAFKALGSIAALDSRGTLKHQDTSATGGLAPCAAQDMGDEASVSRFQSLAAHLKNAMALPRLMQASIEASLKPGREGFKDREMQFMMAGLLGQKKAGLAARSRLKPSRTGS